MTKKISFPSIFHLKVLSQEAPGGLPRTINVVIPSITRPGKAFEVKIAVLDELGYPSVQCNDKVFISMPGHESGRIELAFHAGVPAVGSAGRIKLPEEGIFRLEATLGSLNAFSNPTLCTGEKIPGIFWGDPHVHTVLSRCHPDKCRTLNFCFTCARYVSALDWVSAADHVSNGRCDIAKWREQSTVADLYNDEPSFVTLPAYEASLKGGAGGDNNVYMARFPDLFVDQFENGHVGTLSRELANKISDKEFFIVPHHTTRTGKHGEIPDEIYPGTAAMPVVEIHSKWGTSEFRGNPNPLKDIHPGPSYAVDLLNRGIKLGFIAGTDSHATMPSGGGKEPDHIDRLPGLTAVNCQELSRQAIFNGIRTRHCYAASLERILLRGTMAGSAFGEELRFRDLKTPLKIELIAAARSDITRIDLVRNGKTIHSVSPGSWKGVFSYEDHEDPAGLKINSPRSGNFIYYYARVTCSSGAQAWSSPVWITD
jgi:hypothetical protein